LSADTIDLDDDTGRDPERPLEDAFFAKKDKSARENFGHFSYGATGAAMGFPPSILLRAAGWAQRRQPGNSRPEWGHPWDWNPPFEDDPRDQEQISAGIRSFQCACCER